GAAGPYRLWDATRLENSDVVSSGYWPTPPRPTTRSNIRIVSRVRNSTATTSAGFTIGRVIRTNVCQVEAPSTFAASYTSAGMVCRPARVNNPMNGAVFHTSAITTAQNSGGPSAVHRMCWSMTLFITPASLKIRFHISADTIVGIAHGTRIPARTNARPRNALAMINAIATPSTVSSKTQIRVNSEVLMKAFTIRSIWP